MNRLENLLDQDNNQINNIRQIPASSLPAPLSDILHNLVQNYQAQQQQQQQLGLTKQLNRNTAQDLAALQRAMQQYNILRQSQSSRNMGVPQPPPHDDERESLPSMSPVKRKQDKKMSLQYAINTLRTISLRNVEPFIRNLMFLKVFILLRRLANAEFIEVKQKYDQDKEEAIEEENNANFGDLGSDESATSEDDTNLTEEEPKEKIKNNEKEIKENNSNI